MTHWDEYNFDRKLRAFEAIGFTQGESVKLSSVPWSDFTSEVQKALKESDDTFFGTGNDDYQKYSDKDIEAEDEKKEESGESYDYNNIGVNDLQRTKYQCEHCNSGYTSNESLLVHMNDIHTIPLAEVESYKISASECSYYNKSNEGRGDTYGRRQENLWPEHTDETQCITCGRSVSDHANPNTDYRGMNGDAPATDHYFQGGDMGGSDDKLYFESIANESVNSEKYWEWAGQHSWVGSAPYYDAPENRSSWMSFASTNGISDSEATSTYNWYDLSPNSSHNVDESYAKEDDPDFDNDPDFEGKLKGVKVEPSQYTQDGMDHEDHTRGDIDFDGEAMSFDEDGNIIKSGKGNVKLDQDDTALSINEGGPGSGPTGNLPEQAAMSNINPEYNAFAKDPDPIGDPSTSPMVESLTVEEKWNSYTLSERGDISESLNCSTRQTGAWETITTSLQIKLNEANLIPMEAENELGDDPSKHYDDDGKEIVNEVDTFGDLTTKSEHPEGDWIDEQEREKSKEGDEEERDIDIALQPDLPTEDQSWYNKEGESRANEDQDKDFPAYNVDVIDSLLDGMKEESKELYGQNDPDEILGGSWGTPEDTANDLYNMTSHNYSDDDYSKYEDMIVAKIGSASSNGQFSANALAEFLKAKGVTSEDLIMDLIREYGKGTDPIW